MTEALFLGFFGVLVGAILTFLLVRRATQEARYLELKSNAYADYMNGIVSGSLASDLEKPKAQGDESGAAAKYPLSYAHSRIFILPAGHDNVEMYVDIHL